jgi:hypothetical protein
VVLTLLVILEISKVAEIRLLEAGFQHSDELWGEKMEDMVYFLMDEKRKESGRTNIEKPSE